jgi:ATP-binding cassette subfamily B protein
MHRQRNRMLGSLIWNNRRWFAGAFVGTFVTALMQFVPPAILAELLDHYLGGEPSRFSAEVNRGIDSLFGQEWLANNLWAFGVALVIASLISGVFSFFRSKWYAKGSENIALDLRNRLYNHIQRLPYDYHVKVETGDLLQRCTSDVDTVRRFVAMQVGPMLNAILMVIIALYLMLPLSVKVTLLSLSITPVIFLFSMLFFRLVSRAFRKLDEAEAAMSTVLQENLTGVRVVRAFGQAQDEIEKFDAASSEHRAQGNKVATLEAVYWGLSSHLGAIQTMFSLIVCILEVGRGGISVGDLVVFTGYTGMLMWPIRQLGRILTDSGKCMVSLDRIQQVLHTKQEPEEPNALVPSLRGDIVFDHVSFHYEKGREVLKDISFTVKAGETVAILGPTGSGKSSLVHLLQRLYEPQAGSITIGGVPLKKIERHHLRRRVGLVLQDSFLYSKTIRENLAIAVPDATQADIDGVAQDASMLEFIQKSEKGYDTIVGERGVTLSGGQKQRVAIARTLLKDNDILIFDDSLSAVDTRTDATIRAALLRSDERLTTFIISHRISTLSRADRILVLEDGRITQSGTHQELLQQGGLYARIYQIQAEPSGEAV